MSIELTAVQIGTWVATYFPEMKVISWALQTRQKRKAYRAKTAELKSYLNNGIESTLTELQTGLARARPEGWIGCCKTLADIRTDKYAFANGEISALDSLKHKGIKDKKIYLERCINAVEGISRYAPVVEQTLAELRQDTSKINEGELNAIRNYIGTLRDFYKKNKCADVVLDDELKKFEDRHPLSRIALYSGQKRREEVQGAEKGKQAPDGDAMAYIGGVFTKFRNAPPEYDPRGSYLDKRSKWSAREKNGRSLMARGRHRQWQGWTNDGLVLSCEYVGKSVPTPEDISKRAGQAANRLNNRYEVVCLVGDTKGRLAEFAEQYSHPNLCVFFHSLEDGSLSYNKDSPVAQAFADYFTPGSQPDGIKGLLKHYEQDGFVLEDALRRSLHFSSNEIHKMLCYGLLFFDAPGKYLANTQPLALDGGV